MSNNEMLHQFSWLTSTGRVPTARRLRARGPGSIGALLGVRVQLAQGQVAQVQRHCCVGVVVGGADVRQLRRRVVQRQCLLSHVRRLTQQRPLRR